MTGTSDRPARLPLTDNRTGQALLLVTLVLLAMGVVMVHSAVASVARQRPWYARRDVRHTAFAVLAGVLLCTAWLGNFRWFVRGRQIRWGLPLRSTMLLALAVVCGLAVFIPGVGYAVGGKLRWIRVGPPRYGIGFQPSELIKVAMVIFLAGWLAGRRTDVRSFRRTLLPALAVIGACVGVVITQDFGTAVIITVSAFATLLLAGVPLYYLAAVLVPAGGGMWYLMTHSSYRVDRLTAMVNPWCTTNPSAYQPRQSLVAIISGGWGGKGVGRGMQKLGFLPESSTDFIFSTYCEEWGVAGAALLLGLVLLWIWFARRAAVQSEDRFGRVLAGSLGFLVAFQAVLHIAVDLVAAPPTGMGLPFVSAGGTALLIGAFATALMISVTARRQGEVLA